MNTSRKQYRLIKEITEQSRWTVWNHLQELASDPEVYSERLISLLPHFHFRKLYVYIDKESLLLVCIDDNGKCQEVADEERYDGEPPYYFDGAQHRISPVWQLYDAQLLMRKYFRKHGLSIRTHAVLLSESTFLNAEKLELLWERMGVTVFHRMQLDPKASLDVNTDEQLPHAAKAMNAIACIARRPEMSDIINEQLLAELFGEQGVLNDEKESEEKAPVKAKKPKKAEPKQEKAEAAEPRQEACKEKGKEEKKEGLLWFMDEPSGIIEQNNNVTVKVQVLQPLANPREELERLVGCKEIKARLDELLALTRYNKLLLSAFPNAKVHEVSLHSIFFGNPGTGKTTVCKVFGSLLHEAGVLSKGHIVVAERGTFIGTLWGDEERSMRQVLEMARGGVLMIDEAYLLCTKNEHDPGRLVLQLLMDILADEGQRDIAVVLCGYKEPMLRMLDTNPGLHSRFPNRFEFCDFNVEDLLEISRRRIVEYRYHFTPQAWKKYRQVLADAYRERNPQTWGNARFVANQLERIYIQHASRCTKGKNLTGKQLLTITPADVVPIETARPSRRVGF